MIISSFFSGLKLSVKSINSKSILFSLLVIFFIFLLENKYDFIYKFSISFFFLVYRINEKYSVQ